MPLQAQANTSTFTVDMVLARTNGALLVPIRTAAELIGIAPGTALNWHSRGLWPIPTVKVGALVMVRATDLAAFIEGRLPPPELAATVKRGPGRPRKLARNAGV